MTTTDRIKLQLSTRKDMLPFARAAYEAFLVLSKTMEVTAFAPSKFPSFEVFAPIGKFKVVVFPQKQYYAHSWTRSDVNDFVCVRFSFYDPTFRSDRTVEIAKNVTAVPEAFARAISMPFLKEVQEVREKMSRTKDAADAAARLAFINKASYDQADVLLTKAGLRCCVTRLAGEVFVRNPEKPFVRIETSDGQALCAPDRVVSVVRALSGS